MSSGLIIALVSAIIAIVYGAVSIQWILSQPAGNSRMQEIAAAIQQGAQAYLNRQYTSISIVGIGRNSSSLSPPPIASVAPLI